MSPSWRLSCLIAATSFPLFYAAVSKQASGRRQLDLHTTSHETPVSRTYFYAGGRYADDGTGTGQHIFGGQMYVEKLSPATRCPKPYPLVFIHGQGQTGTVSAIPKCQQLLH
jgi:hypothetical protein